MRVDGSIPQTPASGDKCCACGVCAIVIAGLIAGGASGFVLDVTRGKFDVVPQTYMNPTEEQARLYNDARQAGLRRAATMSAGLGGAAFAGILALALGITHRGIARGIAMLVVGGALGAVLTGVGGGIGQYYYAVQSSSGENIGMLRGVLMQATFWPPVALAVAAATLLAGLRVFARTLVGGSAGAALASGFTPLVGSLVFMVDYTDRIPPDTLGQCLLMALVGGMAVVVTIVAAAPPRQKAPS